MEDCRFETSELKASFMMSTPLWSNSWTLCTAANFSGGIQTQHMAGIAYVAIPAVLVNQLGDLEVADEDEIFSGLSVSLASDEPPAMVDTAMLSLFRQLKIKEGLELGGSKLVVITGHSTGGALATLTALSLLSQPSPPPFRLLCITFGSPLLGNQTLSSSITRSRLAHNFCHVVSIHDLVPRRNNDRFFPFGTYLFCSDNGGVCLDNADSVRKMFLLLDTTGTPNIEEHQRYGHYVSTLSNQFLKSRNFLGGNLSDNSYQAGLALAVESLGFSNGDPSGVLAKECIETSARIGRAPILRSAELAIELSNVLRSRLEIQWYKDRCDASKELISYYDFFKRHSSSRDFRVNINRKKLAKFWDKVLEMVEKNELPFDFHLGKKWVYASQFYQLLTEPLDIAFFYKDREIKKGGGHYLEQGNRPKRYEVIDKWWKESGHPLKEKCVRSRYASATQDTCFWAKLEEAKEYLDEVRNESCDPQRRSLLWGKIVGFESYADTLVKEKEVSADVVAENSSYMVWLKNLEVFKSNMSNGFEMVVDESDAMET